ncbi:MAG: GntR family transcriptional regulator [Halanaerobiaceae bacterium]
MKELDLPPLDSYSYKPLRRQVYEVLREAILTGKLEPGEKITEVEIAEQLNVSRTPVREAIRMLELEEFIVIVPQRGVFVAGIRSTKEIDDIFQVRAELEGLAASLAARNISREQLEKMNNYISQIKECIENGDLENCVKLDISFHQIIYEASENTWLQKILDTLFEQMTRFRSKSLSLEGRLKKALNEHKKLGKALEGGEAEEARKLARKHIIAARDSIVEVFEKQHQEQE